MFQNQSPFQWPGTPAGQPAQSVQPAYGQPPAPAQPVYGQPQPAQGNIAPAGAGSPVPAGGYGASQPAYGQPAPGYSAPQPAFGDPFANVGRVPLTRGEKLFLRAPDMVLAEMTAAKVHNGTKGLAVIFELRVLWSETGANRVGTEPSVVLRKNFYFDAEVTTWMCALLGLQEGRDRAVIDSLTAQNQWSRLCHLATASPDGGSHGPGPFAGTLVLIDCYQKVKQDKHGTKILDAQGQLQYTDLARPEAVSQSVGAALNYLRTCANPAQDPHAEQHYGVVKAALERRLPVPAFDPNALTARIQAAHGAPPAPAQPAPVPGYGQAGYNGPPSAYGTGR